MKYRDVSPTDPDPKEQGSMIAQMMQDTSPEDSDPPQPPKR